MIPNIDILNDFANLQKQNHELSKSNILLANKVIELKNSINKMKINKEKLYELYMKEVEAICEVCDWKTSFSAEECVNIVAYLLEENPDLINYE